MLDKLLTTIELVEAITDKITRDDLITAGTTLVVGALAIADEFHPVAISNLRLGMLFIAFLAVNLAVKVKIIDDVNPNLAPAERWSYLQYMTVFHSQRLNQQHRRFHPRSGVRLLSWFASSALLLILIEVIRRWL